MYPKLCKQGSKFSNIYLGAIAVLQNVGIPFWGRKCQRQAIALPK
ncbi:hypothetical protein [Nostoc sp.]